MSNNYLEKVVLFLIFRMTFQSGSNEASPKTPEGWDICPLKFHLKIKGINTAITPEGKIYEWNQWDLDTPELFDSTPSYLFINFSGNQTIESLQSIHFDPEQTTGKPSLSLLTNTQSIEIEMDNNFSYKNPSKSLKILPRDTRGTGRKLPLYHSDLKYPTVIESVIYHSGKNQTKNQKGAWDVEIWFRKRPDNLLRRILFNFETNAESSMVIKEHVTAIPLSRDSDKSFNGITEYKVGYKTGGSKYPYLIRTEYRKDSDFSLQKEFSRQDIFHLSNRYVGCPDSFCFGAEFDAATNCGNEIIIMAGLYIYRLGSFGPGSVFKGKPELFTKFFHLKRESKALNGYVNDAITIKNKNIFGGKETIAVFKNQSIFYFDSYSKNEVGRVSLGKFFQNRFDSFDTVSATVGGSGLLNRLAAYQHRRTTTKEDTVVFVITGDRVAFFVMKSLDETELLTELQYSKHWPELPAHIQSGFVDSKNGDIYFFTQGFYYKLHTTTFEMERAQPIMGNLINCTDEGYRNMQLQEYGIKDYASFIKKWKETATPSPVGEPIATSSRQSMATGPLIGIIFGGICFIVVAVSVTVFVAQNIVKKGRNTASGSLSESFLSDVGQQISLVSKNQSSQTTK